MSCLLPSPLTVPCPLLVPPPSAPPSCPQADVLLPLLHSEGEKVVQLVSTEAQGLTFGLWDGAGDGGAGGSDCAHGWTHTVRWVGASHRCRVRHPGCRVDGPDGLTCMEERVGQ